MDTPSLSGLSPLQCRKRSAILDGAKTVFLREGFGLATMDDVAAAAGVGKQTVYRHFKSKEALFVGLVSAMCAEVGAQHASAHSEPSDGPPEVELHKLGWLLTRSLITPDSLALYRAIVAEAARLPELGQVFYENGAKVVRAFAANILRKRFDESTAALRAATFVQLALGDAHLELTLGYTVPDVEARFALQIDEAVGPHFAKERRVRCRAAVCGAQQSVARVGRLAGGCGQFHWLKWSVAATKVETGVRWKMGQSRLSNIALKELHSDRCFTRGRIASNQRSRFISRT